MTLCRLALACATGCLVSVGASDPVLGAPGQIYRIESTGQIVVVLEGSRDRVEAGTQMLARGPGMGEVRRTPSVLFDVPAAPDDACPDPAARFSESAPIRRVLAVPLGAAAAGRAARSAGDAWEEAYDRLTGPGGGSPEARLLDGLRERGVRVVAIEPDLVFIDEKLDRATRAGVSATPTLPEGDTHAAADGPDGDWPVPSRPDWHLRSSQLDEALGLVRERLPEQTDRVTIAHLDTGYTECADEGLPPDLDRAASGDFTSPTCNAGSCAPQPGAVDREPTGPVHAHGHGTGTLGVLAGGPVRVSPPGAPALVGPLGGAPFAHVVEYRLSEFVALWQPSVVAHALRWAAGHEVDVVSMSMGGPPGYAMGEAVNAAYCSGIAVFAASGNHFASPLLPASTPRTTVFPARYDRVAAVVGFTADRLTYAKSPWRWTYLWKPWRLVMRGNAGPSWVMKEALAAGTPNVPWLVFRPAGSCEGVPSIRFNGSGTSAATPQVAAAAAAWLQYHRGAFDAPRWRSWEKAEAVYRALFESADRDSPSSCYSEQWFGGGIVRAAAALRAGVPPSLQLRPRAQVDSLWIASALLATIGGVKTEGGRQDEALAQMLATEIAQRGIDSSDLGALIAQADVDGSDADAGLRRRIFERIASEERASERLRKYARQALEGG